MTADAVPGQTPVAPHLAATMLLLRDGPEGVEVLMVLRHRRIAFAGGALVYPGGRVDADDMALARESGAPAEDAATRIAAIRETFEEGGVLLARPRGESGLVSGERLRGLGPSRLALGRGETGFPALLAREGLEHAPDLLVPFAHWVTPRALPKRFDTHFFVALAPLDQIAAHDGGETVESVWIRPRAALDAAEAGTRKLMFPTRMTLLRLATESSALAVLERARTRPVTRVEPEIMPSDGEGITLRIPADAGYGGEVFRLGDSLP